MLSFQNTVTVKDQPIIKHYEYMTDVNQLFENSLSYHIDWCIHKQCLAWSQDWCTMPWLDILYTPDQLFRSSVKTPDGVQNYEAKNGEALLLPPGIKRKLETNACETRGISIHYSVFSGIDLMSFYHLPLHISPPHSEDIRVCIESLAQLMTADNAIDISLLAKRHQLVYTLLNILLEISSIVPDIEKRLVALRRLKGVLEYIEENLDTKITIATLASICCLSPHRFCTLFKEIMACPPHQYLLKIRLQKAMQLLSTSNTPVSDIAKRLGFFDQPHFTRLFKTTTGLTPTNYRKKIEQILFKKLS
jgi:AraC-like DNA-binding protein